MHDGIGASFLNAVGRAVRQIKGPVYGELYGRICDKVYDQVWKMALRKG